MDDDLFMHGMYVYPDGSQIEIAVIKIPLDMKSTNTFSSDYFLAIPKHADLIPCQPDAGMAIFNEDSNFYPIDVENASILKGSRLETKTFHLKCTDVPISLPGKWVDKNERAFGGRRRKTKRRRMRRRSRRKIR